MQYTIDQRIFLFLEKYCSTIFVQNKIRSIIFKQYSLKTIKNQINRQLSKKQLIFSFKFNSQLNKGSNLNTILKCLFNKHLNFLSLII